MRAGAGVRTRGRALRSSSSYVNMMKVNREVEDGSKVRLQVCFPQRRSADAAVSPRRTEGLFQGFSSRGTKSEVMFANGGVCSKPGGV